MINNHPPLKAMTDMTVFVKVWAIAIALGGSFDSLKMFEKGILKGEIRGMVKEVIFIVIAMVGANFAAYMLKLIPDFGNRIP